MGMDGDIALRKSKEFTRVSLENFTPDAGAIDAAITQNSFVTVTAGKADSALANAASAQADAGTALATANAAAPKTAFYLPAPSGSDDTAAVQSVINSAAALGGKTIVVGDRYRINGTLSIAAPVSIVGSGQGEFYSGLTGTASQTMFSVTSSDVSLRGFAITGPQFAAGANQTAINIVGTSAASPLVRVSVNRLRISKFGKNALLATFVNNFSFDDNDIFDVCYTGIGVSSCRGGSIDRNRIRNITQTGYANSYGIYTSRFESDDLVTYPRSADISISNNRVADIPLWDGINTHGGINHTVANNVVTNCAKPIEIVGSDGATNGQPKFAPLDIMVIGNVVSSSVSDGTAQGGIVFVGAQGASVVGTPSEYGTGAIIGNVVRGHGRENSSTSGAILCYYTRGLVVSNNTVVEPSPHGIYLWHTNIGFTVTGNTIVDPWTTAGAIAGGVSCGSDYNQGYIGGNNRVVRAAKTAALVASRGIYIANTANSTITLGDNDMSGATAPIHDAGSKVRAVGPMLKQGALTDRPTATSALTGASFLATDVNGGTPYRCVQTGGTTYAWIKSGAGATEAAAALSDGIWRPRDNAMVGASGDPANSLVATQTVMVTGTQYITRVQVDQAAAITNVMLHVATAGVGVTEASVDIYDATGTRIGTSDFSTAITSVGFKTLPLTVPTGARTPGELLYVGVRATFTSNAPALRGLGSVSVPNANSGTGSRVRFGTAGTGITSPQSTITVSSIAPASVGAQCHWVALT